MKYSNFGIILKGIIIYLVFIISLAVLSEWFSTLKIKNPVSSSFENKLDSFLENIKNDIKKEWYSKFQQKEHFLNYYPDDSFPPSDEQTIIEEASKRIAAENPYYQTQLKTLNNIPNTNQNYIRRATNSDYQIVNRQINLDNISNQREYVPETRNYPVDNYIFTSGSGGYTPKKFDISGLDNYSTNKMYSYFK